LIPKAKHFIAAMVSYGFTAGIFTLPIALSGCNNPSEQTSNILERHWQNIDVQIETRPSPPVDGVNEVWVLLTDSKGNPAWDDLVFIRSSDKDPWKQAIQDGRVGVYRRAILLDAQQHTDLQVQIKHNGQQGLLTFSMKRTESAKP
jgi:hypothetical protein